MSAAVLRLSRRRRIVYGLAAVAIALGLPFFALLGADIYLHGRYAKSAGFNVWGYRGPVASRKRADEYRVALLGGSAAFGYGVNWDEAIPAVLERNLAGRTVGPFRRLTTVNLGYNNEGAYSFKFTLEDYLFLKYDLACLYEGYNDMMGDPRRPNLSVFRHESPVFRLTGYLPIFPIVFKEKAASMLAGGDVGALYRLDAPKTTFRPGLSTRTRAEVLRAAAEVGESLERQLGKVTAEPPRHIDDAASTQCKYPWQEYCRSMIVAIDFARQHGIQVLVVTQPYEIGEGLHIRHIEQQTELASMIERRYGNDPDVRYVNLGDSVDLGDPSLSYDHMHLTEGGNRRVAAGLVEPVVDMAARRGSQPR